MVNFLSFKHFLLLRQLQTVGLLSCIMLYINYKNKKPVVKGRVIFASIRNNSLKFISI